MLTSQEQEVLKYISRKTVLNYDSLQHVFLKYYSKLSVEELNSALDSLYEKGYITCDSEGNYRISDTYQQTKSDKLVGIDNKTNIFEMKHLKTFEHFHIGPSCPECHSENVECMTNGRCECITCGNVFSQEEEFDPDFAEEEEMGEEEMEAPALTSYEESDYDEASQTIQTIIDNAKQSDIELADQLQSIADESDSLEDFMQRAEIAIAEIKGIDNEEAIAVLNSLQMTDDNI